MASPVTSPFQSSLAAAAMAASRGYFFCHNNFSFPCKFPVESSLHQYDDNIVKVKKSFCNTHEEDGDKDSGSSYFTLYDDDDSSEEEEEEGSRIFSVYDEANNLDGLDGAAICEFYIKHRDLWAYDDDNEGYESDKDLIFNGVPWFPQNPEDGVGAAICEFYIKRRDLWADEEDNEGYERDKDLIFNGVPWSPQHPEDGVGAAICDFYCKNRDLFLDDEDGGFERYKYDEDLIFNSIHWSHHDHVVQESKFERVHSWVLSSYYG